MLPAYEELIVTGAWWDLVDPVATSWLGELVDSDHVAMAAVLRSWAVGGDMWKKRSSIIAQVKRRERTDLPLLYDCVEPNLADRRFFVRKAIGWALRAYAWTDPDEISRYVAANHDRLSGLSRREALKNI